MKEGKGGMNAQLGNFPLPEWVDANKGVSILGGSITFPLPPTHTACTTHPPSTHTLR